MGVSELAGAPPVRLGHVADDSIAVSVYVLVREGARRRPELAAAMAASIRMRFDDGYAPVRVDFRGDEIEVADDAAGEDRACDLELSGRLGDITALIAAPLAGGLPKPTTRRGRGALARLADGRVEFDGSLGLARNLLRLLAVDAEPAARAVLSR
ncbi:MAG: hypothetical protein ACRDLS_12340 [Solirubrobacteraceae bacterium]